MYAIRSYYDRQSAGRDPAVLAGLMYGARVLFEHEIFHPRVSMLLARLTEQDHQYDPLDLLDINIRRIVARKMIEAWETIP